MNSGLQRPPQLVDTESVSGEEGRRGVRPRRRRKDQEPSSAARVVSDQAAAAPATAAPPADVATSHRPTAGSSSQAAATLRITAGEDPQRPGSQAGLAARCDLSPLEASAGRRTAAPGRGGDRQAGAAPDRVASFRLRWDQRTREDLNRRIAEGTAPCEAIRCRKRYIARELYQLIIKAQATPITDPSAA